MGPQKAVPRILDSKIVEHQGWVTIITGKERSDNASKYYKFACDQSQFLQTEISNSQIIIPDGA